MIDLSILDDHVFDEFRLINSRERCEFVANFPIRGTTLNDITEDDTFCVDRTTVHFYLQQYTDYIDKPERQDKKHRKILTLNTNGKYLQKAARYMVAMAYGINQVFDGGIDYLYLFLPRSDPNQMITVMYKIFTKRVKYQTSLYRWKGERNTGKIVDRLNRFGLIELKRGRGRAPSVIHPTKVGLHYYQKLLCPVLEYLTRNSQGRNAAHVSNGAVWDAYLQGINPKVS